MGSVAPADVTIPDAVVPKIEPGQESFSSSSASSPEPDAKAEPEASSERSQERPPAPKRKGGRKPVSGARVDRLTDVRVDEPSRYMRPRKSASRGTGRRRRPSGNDAPSTSSNSKPRSSTMKRRCRISSRVIAPPPMSASCYGIRIRCWNASCSKRVRGTAPSHGDPFVADRVRAGIDVQAELALKGSPNLRPIRGPAITGHASHMQKAMLSRQQHVRQRPVMAPPLQTVNPSSQIGGPSNFAGSPAVQPTPPSQHSSPSTARSPGFALQGGMSSPGTDLQAQPPPQQQRPLPSAPHHTLPPQPRPQMAGMPPAVTSQPYPPRTQTMMQNTYYPASFQKHYDQLGKLTRFLSPQCLWSCVRPRLSP